jgi:hypothetical protein
MQVYCSLEKSKRRARETTVRSLIYPFVISSHLYAIPHRMALLPRVFRSGKREAKDIHLRFDLLEKEATVFSFCR